MAPKSELEPKVSTLKIRPVKRPDQSYQSGKEWLKAKTKEDGAEGLWRINHDLYDFTEFIKRHPGGPGWLTLTQVIQIFDS